MKKEKTKKKSKKKVVLILLCLPLLLLATCVASSILFGEPYKSGKIGAEGDGSNVTYTLQNDVLTISGTGAMKDSPTFADISATKVVIESGVTNIGAYAFRYFYQLREVVISDTVTSIGDNAFNQCKALSSITIPNSVTTMGRDVFEYCESLHSVTLSNQLKSIERGTFSNCYSLSDIVIPNSVTSIGNGAFYSCNGLNSIVIPNSVTSIDNSAFSSCKFLSSVTLSNNITSLGEQAFASCDLLKTIKLPDSLKSIGDGAFLGCSSLTEIAIPSSVTTIEESVFNGCNNLTSVTFKNVFSWFCDGESVMASYLLDKSEAARLMKSGKAWSRSAATSGVCAADITAENGPKWSFVKGVLTISGEGKMADYTPFDAPWCQYADDITFVIIEEGIESIGTNAFYGCNRISSVQFNNIDDWIVDKNHINSDQLSNPSVAATYLTQTYENKEWHVAKIVNTGSCGENLSWALYETDKLVISGSGDMMDYPNLPKSTKYLIIEEGVSSIGSNLFASSSSNNINLLSVSIPNTVTKINSGAFRYCSGLTEIEIPSSVTSIGDNAFYKCSSLTSITIPNSVTSIGSNAFNYCSGLTSITISESITSISSYAFAFCSGLTSFTIPNGVTSIGASAFDDCIGLTSIIIPNSVTSMGAYAFSDCSNLESITLSENLTDIGNSAFVGCSSLKDIAIPSSVKAIADSTFKRCKNLTNITMSAGISEIGASAFYGCEKIAEITIPYTVKFIGYNAFNECTNLSSVIFEDPYDWYDGSISVDYNKLSQPDLASQAVKSYILKQITGGELADGLTWNFTRKTEILTISGSGYMPNFLSSTVPWADKSDLIKGLIISDGVTYIGSCAFRNLTNLEYITIPDSVSSIGLSAFYGCSKLTSITLPNNLTEINANAFGDCSGLTSIIIPEKVTRIGESAFEGCTSLTSITLNSSDWFASGTEMGILTSADAAQCLTQSHASLPWQVILPLASGYCGAEGDGSSIIWKYRTGGKLSIYGSGEIITKSSSYNYPWYSYAKEITSLTVADGITNIPNGAFYSFSQLSSIKLPDSIINIGNLAFTGTKYFNTESNWKIGLLYISNHLYSAKTSIDGRYVLIDGTKSIADYAFQNCTKLTEIEIPEGVVGIGLGAFEYCTGLTGTVELPASLEHLGRGAFADCRSLQGVKTGNRIKYIGDDTFKNCSSLLGLAIGDFSDVEPITQISDIAISGCSSIKSLIFGNCVKGEISNSKYMMYSSLYTVELGNGITSIGDQAFYMCTSLYSIKLGDNITSIGDMAFSMCSAIKSITLPRNLKSIGSMAFANCTKLSGFEIPDNLETIGDMAFAGCSALSSITIPATLTSFNGSVFASCPIKNIHVNESNTVYSSIDGVLYSKDGKTLVLYPTARTDESYTVADGTEIIGASAFTSANNLKAIVLPNSVKTIGNGAFFACALLSDVQLGNGLTRIETGAFTLCPSLESIVLPDSLTVIDNSAFAMTGLSTIKIGAGLTDIGASAFTGCPLTLIDVSSSNEKYSALDGNLYTKDGKTLIQYAIGKTDTSFTVPNTVKHIESSAFAYAQYLVTVTISDGVETIGDDALAYCSALTTVNISSTVNEISDTAFYQSGALTSIQVSEYNATYATIDGNLYSKDQTVLVQYAIGKNETSFIVPSTVEKIGKLAFAYATKLESVSLPAGLKDIDSSAFINCTSLSSIKIPASVKHIGASAFAGCTSLQSATFENIQGWQMSKLSEPSDAINPNEFLASSNFATAEMVAQLLINAGNVHWHRYEI